MSRVIGVIARVFLWRLVCSKPRVLVERCGLVAQLVVRVLPTSIRVLLGRGFELSWRRKKRAVGTCRNNTYEWDPPEER